MSERIKRNNTKGSFTLEAAIVFPVVLIIIASVLYVTFLLCIKTSTQSMADFSVRRGIKTWDNKSKDINTGRIQDIQNNLYWNIFDIDREYKEDRLSSWLKYKLDSNNLLHGIDIDVNVQLKNYMLFKKLNTEIVVHYKSPIVYYKTPANMEKDEYIRIRSNSEAVLINPPDFIRNVDFIIEMEKELERKYKGFGDFMDSIRKIMEEITLNIERFGNYEN